MSNFKATLSRVVHDGDIDKVKILIASLSLYNSNYKTRGRINWPHEFGYNLLCDAIQMRHAEIVKELLIQGVPMNNVNACVTDMPLYLALMNNDMEIIDMLLEQGVDIFGKYEDVDDPDLVNSICDERTRHRASFISPCRKPGKVVDLLYSKNSDITVDRAIKTRMLLLATQHNVKKFVKLLLEIGADVDAEKNGKTVLQMAVNHDSETVDYILRFCPVIDSNSAKETLSIAMQNSNEEEREKILDSLLAYGFIICPEYAKDKSFMSEAIRSGHLKIVQNLLNHGADVNPQTERDFLGTYLNCAVCHSHLEIARELINHGSHVNEASSAGIPIHWAITMLNTHMIELLLKNGAIIADPLYWLTYAVKHRCSDVLEIILKCYKKININDTYDGKSTILHIIAGTIRTGYGNGEDFCRAKMAQNCLNRGSIVDAEDNFGRTALYLAIKNHFFEVVEVLLEYGAKINVKYDFLENPRTPLMIAVDKNRPGTINAILPSLPNFEAKDRHGRTVLHSFNKYTKTEIILEMLIYGADIYAMLEYHPTSYESILKKRFKIDISDRHIIKMKALKLCDIPQNLRESKTNRHFYDKCKGEIELLKSTRFGDSIFSVYDLLTRDIHTLAVYMKNRDIVDALSRRNCVKNYLTMFPMYFGLLYYRFKKAVELQPLLTPSAESLDSLIGFALPYPVFMKILGYLNDKDVKNLIDATP